MLRMLMLYLAARCFWMVPALKAAISAWAFYEWLVAVSLVPSTLTMTLLLHPVTRQWWHARKPPAAQRHGRSGGGRLPWVLGSV